MARKRSNRKGQVSKEAFYKGQRTSEREHQSMVWLHACMDDQDKSIICVDTFGVLFVESTRMCGLKSFSRAWISGSSNH